MTTMDRVAATLADVDELLEDADAQTIEESLYRGLPTEWTGRTPTCDWCGHGWHGLRCLGAAWHHDTGELILEGVISTSGFKLSGCRCDSSAVPLDDTWRPRGVPTWRIRADREGLDGWAAQARKKPLAEAVGAFISQAGVALTDWQRHLANIVWPDTSTWQVVGHTDHLHVSLSDLTLHQAPPIDPRDRALQHVRSRNTGPERPPAGRARPPRRLER